MKNIIANKNKRELFEKWMEGLKKEITVTINEEVLKKISVSPSVPGMPGMPGMPPGHGNVAVPAGE
ncbi:hypothetical protein HY745_09610 [Candidatus Desantisbacteria bacterium]|nr:hypothetical protein [Candidatus Desantisbacteria bacterium]